MDEGGPPFAGMHNLARALPEEPAFRPARRRPAHLALSRDALSEMECEPALVYITPEELEGAVTDGATVVDVRSAEERADGAIAGSVHVPAPDGLLGEGVRQLLAARDNLIFHCMDSAERAPRAAHDWMRIAGPGTSARVLKGGFQKFVTFVHDQTNGSGAGAQAQALLENLNLEKWVRVGGQGLVWGPDLGFDFLSDEDAARRKHAGIPVPPSMLG
jgi:rhodanese-related sulfurtransferase